MIHNSHYRTDIGNQSMSFRLHDIACPHGAQHSETSLNQSGRIISSSFVMVYGNDWFWSISRWPFIFGNFPMADIFGFSSSTLKRSDSFGGACSKWAWWLRFCTSFLELTKLLREFCGLFLVSKCGIKFCVTMGRNERLSDSAALSMLGLLFDRSNLRKIVSDSTSQSQYRDHVAIYFELTKSRKVWNDKWRRKALNRKWNKE